jgi:hypothetical protein
MRHDLLIKAPLLLVLCTLTTHGALKNFSFRGIINLVDDRTFQLPASITNGAPFEGFYVFDTSIPDDNSDATVGDYWHRNGPVGIVVKVGGLVFRTHPDHVELLIEVVDRQDQDNYLVRSYNNVCSSGLAVSHISWQLDDPTGTALSNDTLPTTPPTLTAFQSFFGLDIRSDGFIGGFQIRGAVTSIEETPLIIPTRPEVTILEAVEISFPTKLGYFYQIQYSHDMETWFDFGPRVLGTGETHSAFVRKASKAAFYRAEIASTP